MGCQVLQKYPISGSLIGLPQANCCIFSIHSSSFCCRKVTNDHKGVLRYRDGLPGIADAPQIRLPFWPPSEACWCLKNFPLCIGNIGRCDTQFTNDHGGCGEAISWSKSRLKIKVFFLSPWISCQFLVKLPKIFGGL